MKKFIIIIIIVLCISCSYGYYIFKQTQNLKAKGFIEETSLLIGFFNLETERINVMTSISLIPGRQKDIFISNFSDVTTDFVQGIVIMENHKKMSISFDNQEVNQCDGTFIDGKFIVDPDEVFICESLVAKINEDPFFIEVNAFLKDKKILE